eukprot:TRINITY_DN24925_c0_g1_i1.p1 TRINITY_DN24925_c0_g1~~TRINITY_DN24925_c0_g1_i1.p1  ORF type:complete len:270 (+),score=47.97 TRINITY_DN24925_c0_g1_i1:80-889(+)
MGRLKQLFDKHSDDMVRWVGFSTAISVAVVGIRANLNPGLVYCSFHKCPPLNPQGLDVPFLVIGSIILCVLMAASIAVVLCPAAVMDNPKQGKSLSLVYLFVLTCTAILLIVPIIYRQHAVPMYATQKYTVTVTRVDGETADITFSSIYGSYSKGVEYRMEVIKCEGWEEQMWDVSPAMDMIHWDSKKLYIKLDSDISVTRRISDLENEEWYAFVLTPVDDGNPKQFPFEEFSSVHFTNGNHYDDSLVDQRMFTMCYWSSTTGCDKTIP